MIPLACVVIGFATFDCQALDNAWVERCALEAETMAEAENYDVPFSKRMAANNKKYAHYVLWIYYGKANNFECKIGDPIVQAANLAIELTNEPPDWPKFAEAVMARPDVMWAGILGLDDVINASSELDKLQQKFERDLPYFIFNSLCKRTSTLSSSEWKLFVFVLKNVDGGMAEGIAFGALLPLFLENPEGVEKSIVQFRQRRVEVINAFMGALPQEDITHIVELYSSRSTHESKEIARWFKDLSLSKQGKNVGN